MTLNDFIAATAFIDPATEILILDLCGLLSPMEILDPGQLMDEDPAVDAIRDSGSALILTSNPL